MRAFPVRMPSGARYWTVLDADLQVVPAADSFLRQVRFGRDAALCDQLNQAQACYPGTDLVLRYEVKPHPGIA